MCFGLWEQTQALWLGTPRLEKNEAPSFDRIISNYKNTFLENHTFHGKLLELSIFSLKYFWMELLPGTHTAVLVGGQKIPNTMYPHYRVNNYELLGRNFSLLRTLS